MAGQDLGESMIDVGNGVCIGNRLSLSGAIWLEEKTGKGILEWVEEVADVKKLRFSNLIMILVALYLQVHPNEDENAAKDALGHIAVADAQEIIGKALTFEPKNSRTPSSDRKKGVAKSQESTGQKPITN